MKKLLGVAPANDPDAIRKQDITYQTLIYNSSGIREGNRFNDELECIAALQGQGGPKLLIFEQDEDIYEVWDFDEVTLVGNNGLEYNAGGWTLTFKEGSGISGNLWAGIRGIRVYNEASHSIWEPTTGWQWRDEVVSNIHSETAPFVSSSGAGQNIISVRDSGRIQLLAGGVENFEFTGGAFTQNVILSMGDGATVTDDVLKSTNAVIYLPIIGSVNQALSNYPPTHTNLSVGFQLDLNLTNALALLNTPAGNISATNVQAAINELDAEKPQISSGTAAPSSTPGKIGDVYIDTNNKKLYFATGTASSADWTIAN